MPLAPGLTGRMRARLALFSCLLVAAGGQPAASPDIGLTPAERAWIQDHPVIRVGHDVTFEPYAMRDDRGQIIGIDPDFLDLIGRRTGLQFRHETRPDWTTMVGAFKAREVDVLGSVGFNPEREGYMLLTRAYTLAPNVIITRNDSPYLFDLRDLAGRTVSRPRGYVGLDADINELAPGHIRVEFDTTLDCFRAVERGEVFASIADVANAAYLIKQHRLVSLRLGSVISASDQIFFGVRKDWPELAGIMDKAIASITPAERTAINNRWIQLDYRQDLWWARAFRVTAVVAGVAVLFFLLLAWHNRRLAAELAERRRIQAELEEAHRRLALASEEKTELLRMVAHDFRSPITGLLLAGDLLKMTGGSDERVLRDTVAQIQLMTRQMMRLANDLVDVHALEEGRRPYQWAPFDACAVLHETVASHSETAARKRIRLGLRTAEPELVLESDAGAFRQVLDNLLSNAVKFSPADSAVAVELQRTDRGLRLLVRDEGPGLSEDDRRRLFQKYAHGSARPTGGEKSTGLGLWIVQRLVKGLGGEVSCESEPGRGATFIVDLPGRHPAGPAS